MAPETDGQSSIETLIDHLERRGPCEIHILSGKSLVQYYLRPFSIVNRSRPDSTRLSVAHRLSHRRDCRITNLYCSVLPPVTEKRHCLPILSGVQVSLVAGMFLIAQIQTKAYSLNTFSKVLSSVFHNLVQHSPHCW